MKCLNRKVYIVLGLVAVALFFLAPSVRGLLPLLLVAACPLSMVAMMIAMARMGSSGKSCNTGQPDPQAIQLKDAEIAELEAMLKSNNRTGRS